MLRPIDNYFLNNEEPIKSCLQFLRQYILSYDPLITEKWQYGMPFYYYNGRRCCYLWVHKKFKQPYLGVVDGKLVKHPDLITENRSRMKILLIDPKRNLPMRKLNKILQQIVGLDPQV